VPYSIQEFRQGVHLHFLGLKPAGSYVTEFVMHGYCSAITAPVTCLAIQHHCPMTGTVTRYNEQLLQTLIAASSFLTSS